MGIETKRRNQLLALPPMVGMGTGPDTLLDIFWLGTTHISSLVYIVQLCVTQISIFWVKEILRISNLL